MNTKQTARDWDISSNGSTETMTVQMTAQLPLSAPVELYSGDGCHYATVEVDMSFTVHNQAVYDAERFRNYPESPLLGPG